MADFSQPSAGFFLWIKVRGVNDTWKMVMQRGVTHGVLLAPGAAFMADPSKPCNAIRASFAKASYKEMNLVSFIIRRYIKKIKINYNQNFFFKFV